MTGAEAITAELFSQVLPDAEVLEATRAVAHAAQGPTLAYIASKELIRELRDERLGLRQPMGGESAAQAALAQSVDCREGFAALQQKRTPPVTGRD